MYQISVQTRTRTELVDITSQIAGVVREADIGDALCNVFVPHTTAGVTINENADPSVVHDILKVVDSVIPFHDPGYRHSEGNSAAHIKSSILGCSLNVIVEGGSLKLGTWQGIFFAEFDGPRSRKVWVSFSALV